MIDLKKLKDLINEYWVPNKNRFLAAMDTILEQAYSKRIHCFGI
jgi:hypothetical protein